MKKFIFCFLILIAFGLYTPTANAKTIQSDGDFLILASTSGDIDDFSTNCQDFAKTIRIGGYLILLVKVLLPLIIIVKSSLNLISVVTNGQPEELKKKSNQMVTSLIAGIIIFFVPTIVYTIFGFVSKYNDGITEDSKICVACVFEPFSTECNTYADVE